MAHPAPLVARRETLAAELKNLLGTDLLEHYWTWPLLMLGGAELLTVPLHLVRLLGRLHGQLAKHLLVRRG